MDSIVDAIFELAPGAQFTFQNDDLTTLQWLDESIERPSNKKISDKAKEIELQKAQAVQNKEIARQAAIAKLISLGLTEEEVKAFLG